MKSSLASVKEIVDWSLGTIHCDPNRSSSVVDFTEQAIDSVKPLADADSRSLAFFFSKDYRSDLKTTQTGVLLVDRKLLSMIESDAPHLLQTAVVIVSDSAGVAVARVSHELSKRITPWISSAVAAPLGVAAVSAAGAAVPNVHRSSVVDEEVLSAGGIAAGVTIGPQCVVEKGVVIGARTRLIGQVYIAPNVVIGEDCVLFPGVCLYEGVTIGNRVRIHANTVIGSDGFGYVQTPLIGEGGRPVGMQHHKLWHLGSVVIGDDVEIGASSTVDRGTWGNTTIANQAKLDNQVHIGHNGKLDEGAVICGGTCLAGRASVGKFAFVGGLTGIDNAVHVGDGAKVGALSMITKDVEPGSVALGNPQREYREHFKAHAALNRMIKKKGS